MPETEKPEPEKTTLADAWAKGKKIAVTITMAVALLHSLYATYIKPEEEARYAFDATTKSVQKFSGDVDVKIGVLQGRVDTLEKLVISLRAAPTTSRPRVAQVEEDAPTPAPTPTPTPTPANAPSVESEDAEDLDPRPRKARASAGITYDMPKAPWKK